MYKSGRNDISFLEQEPFELITFENYFVRTYYALCQILGRDVDTMQMPVNMIMMAMRI